MCEKRARYIERVGKWAVLA